MNLLELTEAAADKLDTYKNPNIDEWREAINPVLVAATGGGIQACSISTIHITKTAVEIFYSYSARQCVNTDSIKIPVCILTASNPMKEARLYYVEGKIRKCKEDIEQAERILKSRRETLEQLNSHLNKVLAEE